MFTILADADLLIQLLNASPDIFRHLLYYMYEGKIEDDEMKMRAKQIIDAVWHIQSETGCRSAFCGSNNFYDEKCT
jgi:hypothetical protein